MRNVQKNACKTLATSSVNFNAGVAPAHYNSQTVGSRRLSASPQHNAASMSAGNTVPGAASATARLIKRYGQHAIYGPAILLNN
ncbi:hypothetical protein EVAR_6520_1 [Eumeta japonica]|uniref:Uncharacterized protein n=1 Tax=Eumeta variegata TaxID=151549 RepID=A0A4C1SQ83_EUMVA|nr:hypothetical protein EVAR_6520_1 [Eumeta japonica]